MGYCEFSYMEAYRILLDGRFVDSRCRRSRPRDGRPSGGRIASEVIYALAAVFGRQELSLASNKGPVMRVIEQSAGVLIVFILAGVYFASKGQEVQMVVVLVVVALLGIGAYIYLLIRRFEPFEDAWTIMLPLAAVVGAVTGAAVFELMQR